MAGPEVKWCHISGGWIGTHILLQGDIFLLFLTSLYSLDSHDVQHYIVTNNLFSSLCQCKKLWIWTPFVTGFLLCNDHGVNYNLWCFGFRDMPLFSLGYVMISLDVRGSGFQVRPAFYNPTVKLGQLKLRFYTRWSVIYVESEIDSNLIWDHLIYDLELNWYCDWLAGRGS